MSMSKFPESYHKNSIRKRLLIDACIVVSVMLSPWWLSLIILLIAMLFIPRYYEAVVLAVILDLVFRAEFGWLGTTLGFAMLVMSVFVLLELLRGKFRSPMYS